MTGEKLIAKMDKLGLVHSFVAKEIGVNKFDFSKALHDRKKNPRMKEIRKLLGEYLKKRK